MTSPTTQASPSPSGYTPDVSPPPVRMTLRGRELSELLPWGVAAIAFAVLFYRPFVTLVSDWWNMPEAGHGLLLGPVAIWFAWKSGWRSDAKAQLGLGAGILLFAVLVRFASGLAAEMFTMRGSMIVALVGIVVYYGGIRQAMHWWLPFVLLGLSVPLPELVTQTLALPLQFQASKMGAALLETRNIPVLLTGNVIRLPGHELFVTEACSGLRSLTALISTGVLLGAVIMQTAVSRVLILLLAIPIAILVNGIRVFMTGFLVFFVSPELGKGFMHTTEGWLLFLISLSMLGACAGVMRLVERRFRRPADA